MAWTDTLIDGVKTIANPITSPITPWGPAVNAIKAANDSNKNNGGKGLLYDATHNDDGTNNVLGDIVDTGKSAATTASKIATAQDEARTQANEENLPKNIEKQKKAAEASKIETELETSDEDVKNVKEAGDNRDNKALNDVNEAAKEIRKTEGFSQNVKNKSKEATDEALEFMSGENGVFNLNSKDPKEREAAFQQLKELSKQFTDLVNNEDWTKFKSKNYDRYEILGDFINGIRGAAGMDPIDYNAMEKDQIKGQLEHFQRLADQAVNSLSTESAKQTDFKTNAKEQELTNNLNAIFAEENEPFLQEIKMKSDAAIKNMDQQQRKTLMELQDALSSNSAEKLQRFMANIDLDSQQALDRYFMELGPDAAKARAYLEATYNNGMSDAQAGKEFVEVLSKLLDAVLPDSFSLL